MSHYSILSLDGGGIKGIMTTRILSWVEKKFQQLSSDSNAQLIDFFDFFVGTSTGGLMQACYLMPAKDGKSSFFTAQDVEDLYLSTGDEIFSLNIWQKILRGHGMASAKYPARSIEKVLNKHFGDMQLNQLMKPCLITAYDLTTNSKILFRQHRAKKQQKDNFYLRDICRATTSAPTYFPPAPIQSMAKQQYLCIDGGIFAHNPALFGYAELRRLDNEVGARNMLMLSIGTGGYLDKFDEKEVKSWGKLEWYRPLVELMSNGHIDNTDFQMRMIFRENSDHYLRIDPNLENKEANSVDLATKENIGNLLSIADDYIKENEAELTDFIEQLYKKKLSRPSSVFDKIADISVTPFWQESYPAGVPHSIHPDAYPNIIAMMEEACLKYSNRVALEQFGHSLTYDQCHRHIEHLAAWLQNVADIQPGDRLAIMMPNCPQYLITAFAALKVGGVIVNINPIYTTPELEHLLKLSTPKVIVCWDGAAHILSHCSPELIPAYQLITSLGDMLPSYKGASLNVLLRARGIVKSRGHLNRTIKWLTALNQGRRLNLYRPIVKGEDLAFLQFTGGTTGKPKAAMLTHRNLIANMLQAKACLAEEFVTQEKEQRVSITALPLYHIFALMANGLLFFHLGMKNILIVNARDIDNLVKILSRYPFHGFAGVNTLFKALLAHPKFRSVNFDKLLLTLGGGMAVQKSVADEWQQVTGCHLSQAYGLTEASPAVTINPHTLTKFNGSIGLPIPSTEVAIVDDHYRSLPVGETGLLFVRGPQVMAGYWHKTDATSMDLSLDGWLNTGDLAYMNPKGFVFIVDRAKDLIIVSGFNVYPNEVEEVVDAHPKVTESGCIGVADPKSGEAVKVFVVVKPGLSCSKEEIIAHCQKSLTAYKTPDQIEFVSSLPKSPVGKILRKDLHKLGQAK